jgi:HAMP domain-containing protein
VIIGTPTDRIRSLLASVGGALAWLTALTMAAVGLLTYFIARRFSKPLALLRDAMKTLAAGDYDIRLPVVGSSVAAEACAAFNKAAQSLSGGGDVGAGHGPSIEDILNESVKDKGLRSTLQNTPAAPAPKTSSGVARGGGADDLNGGKDFDMSDRTVVIPRTTS